MAANNLGELLRASCSKWGDEPAFLVRSKHGFEPVSYATLWQRATAYAAALRALGVARGDRVAIQSENCPEWAQADWACQLLGAILVPIYPTLPPDQSQYIVADSEAKLLLAGSDEQTAKHAAGRPAEILQLLEGEDSLDARAQQLLGSLTDADVEEAIRGTLPGDPATIIYTSGTTGAPKGAILAHEGFTSLMEAIVGSLPIDHNDRFLSFLPMSHVYERVAGQILPISCGATIGFAGSLRSLPSDMKAVQPTVMLCVPRFLESIRDKVVDKASKAPLVRRKLFNLAKDQLVKRYRGKPAPLAGLMDVLVGAKVRELTGGKLRFFVSGGAALPTHVSEFFMAFGMPMLQGYGLTETTAATCINHPDDNHPDTVGPPIAGVEVRIADDGEILVRGKSRMIGYWNLPEETAQAIDSDGWFHTGDIGVFEGPYLKITDRKKDILVLGNGKNVAPQPIENKLKESPLIAEAVLFGDGMDCVCALIVPDFDALTQAAAEHGLAPAPPEQLIELDAVKQLIKREIDAVNKTLANFELVKKHRLLSATFSIEGGELTPTLKVRRKVVKEKYADVLADLLG
ncbi:MAG: long-chain fatty acid--CoA ligase [Fimbriimonadaceae bacterium]|nr:long-chain fatty acid--CoA ligase [Fimbriimonadaceae bacterium]